MTISSRTPEGTPHRCSICGKVVHTEPSPLLGDSCCPNCGQLLGWFQNQLAQSDSPDADPITPSTPFATQSLDVVELVMAIEEEFGLVLSDAEAAQFETVADAIRWIEQHRLDEAS